MRKAVLEGWNFNVQKRVKSNYGKTDGNCHVRALGGGGGRRFCRERDLRRRGGRVHGRRLELGAAIGVSTVGYPVRSYARLENCTLDANRGTGLLLLLK